MAHWRRIATALILTTLLASGARAADDELGPEVRTPKPRQALTAAALNLFFLPVRIPLTVVGAMFAGMTGFLTFGGEHAADDVFGLVDGTQVIDEHVIEGREPFCIGRLDCPR